ncbi:MAG: nucleotide sugar dehydrogenase [Tardiphaga sp.]
MRVAVIGLGYVGLVQTAALLRDGHQVCGIDTNDRIRARLARGEVPYREPGVADLIAAGHADGRLTVTARIQDQADADLVFICVGTEGLENGALDLASVVDVARDLGAAARLRPPGLPPLLLVFRCTMLPGSMRDHVLPAIRDAAGDPPGARYDVVYHPEFTREGSALADYLAPARLVIGENRPGAARALQCLLAGIDAPVFMTSFEVAELTKLADNSFHALKVGFANEIGRLALRSNISPDAVFDIFTADTKLNLSASYLRPGPAFGGPCLPKDVRALAARAHAIDVAVPILDHILASNTSHTAFLLEEIERRTAPQSRILLLGLSFKHGTDDLRHSSFVRLAEMIVARGHDLAIYDPDLAVDGDAETITRLAPQLMRRIVPRVSLTTQWDLVVVGKEAPDVLSSLPETIPVFTVNRL